MSIILEPYTANSYVIWNPKSLDFAKELIEMGCDYNRNLSFPNKDACVKKMPGWIVGKGKFAKVSSFFENGACKHTQKASCDDFQGQTEPCNKSNLLFETFVRRFQDKCILIERKNRINELATLYNKYLNKSKSQVAILKELREEHPEFFA